MLHKLLLFFLFLIPLNGLSSDYELHAIQSLLVISADPSEAQPTMDALAAIGLPAEYYCIGVSINAALNIAVLKSMVTGRNILYVGSAGTLDGFTTPYITTPTSVYWMPEAQRVNIGDALMNLFPPLDSSASYIAAALPKRALLTSPTVSHIPDINISGLPDRSLLIENMEGYYVVQALQQAGAASIDVIMGITDTCGPDAYAQWVVNAPIVAQQTATYVSNFFKSLSSRREPMFSPTGYRAVPVSVEGLNSLVLVETCFGRFCRAVREKFR